MRARGAPLALSAVVTVLMGVQAVLGLTLADVYRDAEPIRTSWFGNDGVTLAVAVPALAVALALARRGSVRATLVWLGLLGYSAYNDAFYLFGSVLNAFFPLYVALLVLSVAALILGLAQMDVAATSAAFAPRTPVRLIAGYLTFLGVGLAVVWLVLWTGHVFTGRALPTERETFTVVAALDLTVLVPALVTGGVLLWRRRPWGYVVATLAGVQSALYLLVLAVNSAIAVGRGLAATPGELPVWAPLAVATAAVVTVLLACASGRSNGRLHPRAAASPTTPSQWAASRYHSTPGVG